ncbi:hypothetical protein PR048_018196 [Dryococelus australis]|uniref:Uncharacterized protein n=1 Tax=Dryococelus australis TaxID=614101 RepID=A0ABQ9HBU0_9NEOP|nr:hypothetical protein PR048_018196 [Dryococelus australis]
MAYPKWYVQMGVHNSHLRNFQFPKDYGFAVSISSPIFAESNVQVENAVKTAKKILSKSTHPNLGLLA